jgi:hypothetical protein
MRVAVTIYEPPGRGISLTQHLITDDAEMPTAPEEFALRSVRAVKHFFPKVSTGRALTIDQLNSGRCFEVEGESWKVQWATDGHVKKADELYAEFCAESGSMTFEELMKNFSYIQTAVRTEL